MGTKLNKVPTNEEELNKLLLYNETEPTGLSEKTRKKLAKYRKQLNEPNKNIYNNYDLSIQKCITYTDG